jgi:hypothetical protein
MTNNNNNFYTIAAFSLSREINNIQHIIASSYFTDSIEHFDFNKIDERLQLLDCKKLVLVYVTEADSVTKTIRYGKSINTDFIYHSISFANFFTNSFLSEYFYSKKDMTAKNMIFIFENRRWNELLVQFRRFNILISGGSSGKRHILSPVQHRLSQFITCVEGMNTTKIVDSFHYSEKWNSRPTINLATKNMNEAIKELNEDLITTPQGNNKVNSLKLNITQKREYLSSLNMEEDSNQSSNDKIKTPEIKNETEIKDNTININSSVGSLHISDTLINRAINAVSTIGGMKLGIGAAKNVQGVGGKLVAGVGGAILAHSIKNTINTIDEANKGNNSKNNFMFSLINSENIINNSNLDLTQYPMSLFSDLNLYQNLALFFLFFNFKFLSIYYT